MALTEQKKNTRFRWGNLKDRDYLEKLGIHGKLYLKQRNVWAWTALIWPCVIFRNVFIYAVSRC